MPRLFDEVSEHDPLCDNNPMPELVYISTSKLHAYDLLRRRGPFVNIKAALKFGFGELSLEGASLRDARSKLKATLKEQDYSDQPPVPLTEKVQDGQWVSFDAQMSYVVIDQAVVFLETEDTLTTSDSGHPVRLILHGSSAHLVEGDPPKTSIEELSAEESARSIYDAEGLASVFEPFVRLVEYASGQDVNDLEESKLASFRRRLQGADLDLVIPTLTENMSPRGAVWLSGRARVTCQAWPSGQSLFIFASPLYVERISPPELAL